MNEQLLENRLRLLLLNDEVNVDLGTELVELVQVPHLSGNASRLGSWTQHMFLWSEGSIPDFDLLLIDINFFQDPDGPRYRVDMKGKRRDLRELEVDPFGLLHALPLAALQRSTKMPFVWKVHSFKPEAVAHDPVAQWAFGMLVAMQGDKAWIDFMKKEAAKHLKLSDYFATVLLNLPGQIPSQVLPLMIDGYREELLKACSTNVDVDISILNRCLEMVEQHDIESLKKESLRFVVGSSDHLRSIRSLFADHKIWDEQVVQSHVAPFLKQIQQSSIMSSNLLYQEIVGAIKKLRDHGEEMNIMTVTRHVNNAYKALVRFGIVVFSYLDYYAEYELEPDISTLLRKLGYRTKPEGHFRRLSDILLAVGRDRRPKALMTSLQSESLENSNLRRAARDFWNERTKGKKMPIKTPRCLQPPQPDANSLNFNKLHASSVGS